MALALLAAPASAASTRVEICHIPPGNPENFHSITVSEKALSAHLAHGDVPGVCNDLCAEICDDGNACTVDDTGDCASRGCPVATVPVDCDDGSLCTADSCNEVTGCVNTATFCAAPDLCTVSMCAPDTGDCLDTPVVRCIKPLACNPNTGLCEDPDGGGGGGGGGCDPKKEKCT